MTRTWMATLLNFFLPGAGYLLLGHKVPLALAWLTGVFGLTYGQSEPSTPSAPIPTTAAD